MSVASAAVVRRIVSGLIVLAMLLSSASLKATPAGHTHHHGATQAMASSIAAQHCADKARIHPDMMDGACCLGSSCTTLAALIAVHPVTLVAWSSLIRYWAAGSSSGSGIKLEPDLGPPIIYS
jgi:hypothetical protein